MNARIKEITRLRKYRKKIKKASILSMIAVLMLYIYILLQSSSLINLIMVVVLCIALTLGVMFISFLVNTDRDINNIICEDVIEK